MSRIAAIATPATSLSFPVTHPGHAAFRMWSLTSSTTTDATNTGVESSRKPGGSVLPSVTAGSITDHVPVDVDDQFGGRERANSGRRRAEPAGRRSRRRPPAPQRRTGRVSTWSNRTPLAIGAVSTCLGDRRLPATTVERMGELFLGGDVDPATHERTGDEVRIDTDKFTTHGVIVGMTGSGKTGLGVVLLEEVLASGLPTLIIDPKGDLTNLCLTFPSLSPTDFRPWIDEAQANAAGVSPDEFAQQQSELWAKGLLGWGYTTKNIADLRATTDFTIYTPGSQSGVPVNIVGSLQVPGRPGRCRDRRRRDRGLRVGAARPGRDRGRPPVEPRAHPALQPDQPLVGGGQGARPPDARRAGRQPADPQTRRLRARPVLPAERPHEARHAAQRSAGVTLVRGVGRRAGARHPIDALHVAGRASLRDRDDRPPQRRGAPVRHLTGADEARHLDAPPVGHHRPACDALHGRGRRLPAADGESADQEADHDAHEAGAGVRRRRGALDAEPGRHRLQGALERRHLDDRSSLDRAGQGTTAGGPHLRRRQRRHRCRRRHDLRSRQARVRAAGARQGRHVGLHHPVGDELPARADDARPDQRPDGRTAGGVVGERAGGPERRGQPVVDGRDEHPRSRRRRDDGDARRRRRRSGPLGRRRGALARRRRWRLPRHTAAGGDRRSGPTPVRRDEGRSRARRGVRMRDHPDR